MVSMFILSIEYFSSFHVNMVNCAAYGCRSGYKSQKSTTDDTNEGHQRIKDPMLSYHAFPIQDKDLCDKWVRAIRRENFIATKYSKLCSVHFKESDFVEVSRDTNKQRRKSDDKQLRRRYLKDGAVPSILPNAPQYLTNTSGVPRTTVRATSSSRLEYEANVLEQMEESFLAADDISQLSTAEIADRLQKESTLPQGFTMKHIDQTLFIYIIQVTDDVPRIKGSITVKADRSPVVSVDDNIIPMSQFKDLASGSLTRLSQIVNLMARVKSLCSETLTRSLELLVHMAIESLKAALTNIDDSQNPKHRKLSFIVEQLQLLMKHKFSLKYSPQLIIMCFMVYAASRAAYTVLREENILEIPSISTLRKVTRRVNVSEGLDNSSYLKLRVSKLNAFERVVILMIDEIYIAKRVEYSGGEMKGLTPDGAVASTLLCFMVKSLVSKFKDLVGIYPMANLTAAKQFECYNEVMTLLRSVGLNVIAIYVDNAATNRKFFVDFLCNGQLQTSIIDSVTGQPIFLIFDPVHDLKNVYNNFQSRKTFQCPPMGFNLPPEGCTAEFQHIIDLFNIEAVMSLKKAHRLSPAVLQPKNIEKLSVKLATAVFNESTRDALQFYAAIENKPHWMSTAAFIKLIIKLWNIMNVKSSHKGKHKRDYTMDPVRSSSDWKLVFLREFADFLWRWETSKSKGLTRQTFLALRHTCLALADCAAYLLDRLAFNYAYLAISSLTSLNHGLDGCDNFRALIIIFP